MWICSVPFSRSVCLLRVCPPSQLSRSLIRLRRPWCCRLLGKGILYKTPLPAFLASFPTAPLSHRLTGWSQVTGCNFLPQLHRICATSGSFPPPGIAGLPSPSGIDRPLCCQPRAAGQGCVRAEAPGGMVLSPQGLGVSRDKGGEWWRERGEGASGPRGQGVRIEETRGQPPPDLTALWFPFL